MEKKEYDMPVIINLKSCIDGVAEKLSATSTIEVPQKAEYILMGVNRDILVEYGFEFVSYDRSGVKPIYKYYNLEAVYDNNILHLYQIDG